MAKPSRTLRDRPLRGEYNDQRDMDRFWDSIKPKKEPFLQRWYLPALLLTLLFSVPWYFPRSVIGRIVAGLPLWVWATVASSLLLSSITAFAILGFWRDDSDDL